MTESIVYTNDNCIGCNKCINVCSAMGACISEGNDDKARIVVDGSKCVACGSCIDVCVHGAREFRDDTERFFSDLAKGEKISLLLAPAFKANYPDRYDTILGGLKAMGVNRIISVSFGADITTWGYINYIKKYDFLGGISQPCPAVVAYIERYLPELLPKLFPVQSPLMCAAIYARKKMGIKDKFAFISPCIAKKMEIEDLHNDGLVQYNVTFEHLIRYVDEHNISGKPASSEIEYGLGSFYPTPGGLAETVRWFLGDQVFIRQIEGEKRLYEWLHKNSSRITNRETPFLFIDALNCEDGCICGTAVDQQKSATDDALYELLKIRESSKKETGGNAWSRPDPPEERLKNYNKQFKDLVLEDFIRGYTDRSAGCTYKTPSEDEFEEIFTSMNKITPESREINCTCCGYESCKMMATAIYNGFNHKENCIYYEKMQVHKLEAQRLAAEETAKAKSEFLANVSHEFRTPINAVLGMDELIIRETTEERIRGYADNIRNSSGQLLDMIDDVLDFAKIDSGKLELELSEYDLVVLIRELEERFAPMMRDKGLDLKISVDENVPRYLYGDMLRIRQCLMNLLTNAHKYTQKGGVTFSVCLVGTDRDDAYIGFKVSDTGKGIREEDFDRLFDAFDRLELNNSRTVGGSGLGMNIVQNLLALMDSELEVESEYGVGSDFSFTLRQTMLMTQTIGDYKTALADAEGGLDSQEALYAPDASILVVDDTEMNLVVVKSLLKSTGLKIDTALSGRDALKMMDEKEYDILVFDHMMPEMDGIELLKRLRRLRDNPNSKKPCIVLTANAVAGAREMYLSKGFDDYMSKPVDGKALERLLRNYLPAEKIGDASVIERKETTATEDPSWLTRIKGLDTEVGIRYCGSEEEYKPILKIFYDSIDIKADELDGYYENEDWDSYTIKVHALKSSARVVGATELGEFAFAMETAGKEGNIEHLRANHKKLMSDYRRYKDLLKDACEEKKAGAGTDKPKADKEIVTDILTTIREAAAGFDFNTIEDVFVTADEYSYDEEDEKLIKSLRDKMAMLDYDEMIRIIDESGAL